MWKTNFCSNYYHKYLAKFNRFSGWLLFVVVFLPFLVSETRISPSASLSRQTPNPVDCRAIIAQFTEDDFILQKLADPIITSQAQMDAQLQKFTLFHNCLDALPKDQYTNDLDTIDNLVEYYLLFAGGDQIPAQGIKSERIDLAQSKDPAVVKLRDEIGIPPPSGWIFVRYYPSRQAMPERVRYAFDNPQVAGVTILSKYIAIISEPKASWAERALQELASPDILSHELVHAYVNSVLASNNHSLSESFPLWFDEGLASYISHSDTPHSIITQNLTINQTATEEYQSYVLIFKFLQNRLGQKRLNEKIRLALETANLSQLYADLGIQDERWLEITANEWQRQRIRKSYFFGLIILGAAVAGLYWLLPELECSCGFTGRQRDFPGGKCPNCGEPVLGAQRRSITQSTRYIYPDCQVCGRRFLPWQRSELQIHKRLVRIWVENPTARGQPLAHHIHRVCLACLARSQDIAEEYHHIADEKFDTARRIYGPIYREWLKRAPLLIPSPPGLLELSLEQALEQMLLAALSPTLTEWLDRQPLFRFTETDVFIEDDIDILSPPQKYDRILQDVKSGQIGSMYRASDNNIEISWES
jgi:hypothetical protein